jgi:hypothetical protein
MSEPKRSAALKRALATEGEGLPADFAGRVAAMAEARVRCVPGGLRPR